MANTAAHHQTQPNKNTTPTRRATMAELLATWQAWSWQDLTERAVAMAEATGDTHSAEVLRRDLVDKQGALALGALAASYELTCMLDGGRWHVILSARESGASWQDIAAAAHTTADEARADYLAHIERSERYSPKTDMHPFRAVLDD